MARMSAHSIKSNGRGIQTQDKPREGTKLRKAYDLLMSGQWIDLHCIEKKSVGSLVQRLVEYDLEIRSRPNPQLPSGRRAKRLYQHRCVGVWNGGELCSVEEVEIALENSVLRDDKGLK